MFDIEQPNGKCVQSHCSYLKQLKTIDKIQSYFCSLNVNERFDKCPLWLRDCKRIGVFEEERFEKTKLPNKEGFTIFDNWYGHSVDYLPIFTDEYQCDKFVEWLNEIYSGGL